MSDFTFTAQPALGGYHGDFVGISLEEVCDLAIVSIATPRGGADALASALKDAFGVTPPKAGKACQSKDGSTQFLGTSGDQMFAVFDDPNPGASEVMADKLNNTGYCTLQSDNWVALKISGVRCREALVRISPIDLSAANFPVGSVARTAMEHMGVIIYPEGDNTFVLLSASSSAASFLDALETSIHNVL